MAGQPTRAASRCPICRAPTVAAYRPFCSARCRDVDLARWLGGGYAIPGRDISDDADGNQDVPGTDRAEGKSDDETH